MTVSRAIHVSANGSFVPFNGEVIFLAIVYMWRIVFIYSPVDKYLGCFHVLVIVKSAAINIGVHVFLEIMVLCPRVGLLSHMADFSKILSCSLPL